MRMSDPQTAHALTSRIASSSPHACSGMSLTAILFSASSTAALIPASLTLLVLAKYTFFLIPIKQIRSILIKFNQILLNNRVYPDTVRP